MTRVRKIEIAPHKKSGITNNTSQIVSPVGNVSAYKEPFSRDQQIEIMKERHNVIVSKIQTARSILMKAPYNLLVYEGFKIWYSRTKNGKIFKKGTSVEYLYELYKFDSFLKGKLLEVIRPFENMFVGSLAYHFELEYKNVYNSLNPRTKEKIPRHNVGYKYEEEVINLIPLWDYFFKNSKMSFKKEIEFWDYLSKNPILTEYNEPSQNYRPTELAKRFSPYEVEFISEKFKTATVRGQVIDDIFKYSAISEIRKWRRKIGARKFSDLLDLIRQLRNESSHPGYIINIVTSPNPLITDSETCLKEFIELMPYFTPEDIYKNFITSVKESLFALYTKKGVDIDHIQRIENKLGIYMIEKSSKSS